MKNNGKNQSLELVAHADLIFSITAGLPAMKAYFSQFGYSAGQVELLVSLPAFAVVVMLFLNSRDRAVDE